MDITATEPLNDYNAFTLTDPSRLVIDVKNAVNAFGAKRVPVHAYGIAAVRLGDYPDHVRVVLDAEHAKLPAYTVMVTDRGMKVTLDAQRTAVPGAPTLQPEANGGAAEQTGLMVTAITAERQAVDIATSEHPSYKTLTLVKPTRLVIDIANASNAIGTKRIPVHKYGIAAIRLGSHPGYLRVVLDAAGENLPAYQITETDNGLKVDLTAP